jgi:hypothetical protein
VAAKWRVLTDVSEIQRMVRAGLAYWNCVAGSGRPYELAGRVWERKDNAELGACVGHLFVLAEDEED